MKANILSARISTCMKSRAVIAPRQEVSDDPAPRRPRRCRRISRFLPSVRIHYLCGFSKPGGRGECSPRAVREQGGSRLIIKRGC